jgi:DNA (cytosine-5)-methyltransferase 1
MSKEQVWRLNEESARKIYNNIQATHNLVNIQQVGGDMLDIIDKDKYTYLLTYSFPCQDISNAGNKAGFEDTSTRSGMLWEVERILKECKELDQLPQILLMENVPLIHSVDNMPSFARWIKSLEDMGYKNYYQDLIATDYGIPQTRNRCFMVSVLGNYKYTFPETIPLEKKLKDLLEDNVDEKYYLSDTQIQSLESGVYNASKPSVKLEITDKGLCQTLDTMSGGNRQPLVRIGNKSLQETLKQNKIKDTCYIDTYNKRIDEEKSGTITTGVSFRNNTFLAVKNATKKGYLEAHDGDGIDISSRMQHHRGTVQKQKAQTLNTMGGRM